MAKDQSTFNAAWLGDEAKEHYTDEELRHRWEAARRSPDERMFDYETGEVYVKRGAGWVSGISLLTPVPDYKVERAAERWLLAEAPGLDLDPDAEGPALLRGLALAYPHLYVWDYQTRQLIDRANRYIYQWDDDSRSLAVSGTMSPEEYWNLIRTPEPSGGQPGIGPVTTEEELEARARLRGRGGAEGEEATSVTTFDPIAVLTGEDPAPAGWILREFETESGQWFRAVETPRTKEDGETYQEGYALLMHPDGSVQAPPEEGQLQFTKEAYNFNIQLELKPSYIGGLPEGYTVPNPQLRILQGLEEMATKFGRFVEPEAWAQMDRLRAADLPAEVAPQYYDWDNYYQFGGKSAAAIRQIQQGLVDAGFMTEKEAASEDGYWGKLSGDTMGLVMFEAASNGYSWSEWLEYRKIVKRNYDLNYPDEEAMGRQTIPYSTPAYLEPDYATVSQTVKSFFAEQLGRDPHDYEMSLLADQLFSDYRGKFESEVSAARATHEAGNRAIKLDVEQGSPGTFQAVDPLSRLAETFEQQYEPEMDIIERREQLHSNLGVLMGNLSGLESMVGRY